MYVNMPLGGATHQTVLLVCKFMCLLSDHQL